jgi:hypothetical protein
LVRYKWHGLGVFVWLGIGTISAGGLRRRRVRRKGKADSSLDAADVLLSIMHILFAPVSLFFWLLVAILGVFTDPVDLID